VANMSDEDIYRLNRGGHDPVKVYAAYKKAENTKGRPTVILAKTVKGFGLGASGEALNIAHNVKKMDIDSLKHYRDRFNIPVSDENIADLPFFKFSEESEEFQYMKARREALGGALPARRQQAEESLDIPALKIFEPILKGSGEREVSSTMTFVRVLNSLLKDKKIGKRIVPIIPDEARTFGMEGLFRQVGIYASEGQKYVPQDADQVAYYREDKKGQVLQEGINELGAMASWVASGTSYSTCNATTIPFYIYYSMFGFQRVGDLAWAAADSQTRGFLLGATAGRTTLNGEGLQHQDGHSHVQGGLIPNCVTYDPTYGYEIAVIVREGLRRMYEENENIFFYLTLMNENYQHPAMPDNKTVEDEIIKGIYQLERVEAKKAKANVQLMGSGTILQKVRQAAQILSADYGVSSDVYSVTSFNELAREGQAVTRWNMLHPESKQQTAYLSRVITSDKGPAIAATDYVKNYSDQVRAYINTEYRVLGTDGFGRSDSRDNLRQHFEVDQNYIVIAALYELANRGDIKHAVVSEAIKRFNINADKLNPLYA
jgi:pyruvate dehydrogenase E1 component